MNPRTVNAIFSRFKKRSPSPSTELHYRTPFELLIAVILSAQATDRSVNLATATLFQTANTPRQIISLGLEGLKSFIRTIGLYNTKAKNIIQTCQILCEQYDSEVPNSRDALESLPGVGRKTANVVLNTAFGHSTIAVDTHIFRVSRRLGLASGKTPLEVEKALTTIIPHTYQKNAHHWLILHGRYICQAKKPKCMECFLNDLCEYTEKVDL